MKNKLKYLLLLVVAGLLLTACSDEQVDFEMNTGSDLKVIEKNSNENVEITKEAERLFSNMINVGKLKSDEEVKKTIEENVYFPAEYLETLVDNDMAILEEDFFKISAVHKEGTVKKVNDKHYIFHSYATVEKQEKMDSEPIVVTTKVSMELKEKNGSYKIVRLNIKPN